MGGSGRDNGWRETPIVDAALLGGVEKLPDRPSGRDLLQETVKALSDTIGYVDMIQYVLPYGALTKSRCQGNDDLHESM